MIASNPWLAVDEVAERHGFTREALLRHDQRRHVTKARREAMNALRAQGLRDPEIAALFGMTPQSVRYARCRWGLVASLRSLERGAKDRAKMARRPLSCGGSAVDGQPEGAGRV